MYLEEGKGEDRVSETHLSLSLSLCIQLPILLLLMPLSCNLRTILRYTHTAEFSEIFLCMQRGTHLHSGIDWRDILYMLGRDEFVGRIDRNSLASDWLLGKKQKGKHKHGRRRRSMDV